MVSSEIRPGTFPQHFRQPCSCIAVSGRGAGVGRFPLVAAVLSFEVAAQVIAFWAVPVRHLLGRAPTRARSLAPPFRAPLLGGTDMSTM